MKNYEIVYPHNYDQDKQREKKRKEEEELCNKCKICFCISITIYCFVYFILFFIIAIKEDLLVYDKKDILLDSLDNSYSGSNYI